MSTAQKKTNATALLLALVIVSGMIVSPVSAISTWDKIDAIVNAHVVTVNNIRAYTYDGSADGDAIYMVKFTVPMDAYVNFTLYYGTTSSVVGSAQSNTEWVWDIFHPVPTPRTRTEVELNGVSKSYTFWDIDPVYDYNIAGYSSNGTDMIGFAVYSADYRAPIIGNDLAVIYAVSDIPHNLIYKIQFSGSKPFSLTYISAPVKNILDRILPETSEGLLDEFKKITALAWAIWSALYLLVIEMFYWLKFFFWDNLILTTALYIALTGAVAFNQSKDIWGALKKFFQYQRGLYNFIISMWNSMIDIISKFRDIFRL